MTRKKQPPKNDRLSIQDLDYSLRRKCEEIAAAVGNGETNISFGGRYAISFTWDELQRITAPLNYQDCAAEELIALCAHGNDWRTREAAARELARRSEVTR